MTETATPTAAGSKKDRAILLAGLITYGVGQSLLYIIFAPLGQKIGMPAWQIGTIISISNLAILFAAPFWGRRSDTLGRRSVFVLGLVGYSVGYAALGVGLQLGLAGALGLLPLFLTLVAARLIYGGLAGAIQPAAQAYVADTTDESSRSQGMALIASAGGLGTIIGPVFAGGLAEISPLFPMYAAAAVGLVAAVWAQTRLVEPAQHQSIDKQEGMFRVMGQIFPYLLGWVVVFFVFTALQTIAVFMVQNQLGVTDQQEQIRIMRNAFIFMALITVLIQIVVMQVWKMQPKWLLRIAFLLFAAVVYMMTLAQSRLDIYLVFVAMGFAVSLIMPSLTAAASLTVGKNDQGVAAGLLAAAPTFGMVLGPMGMAILYEYDTQMPFQFMTAMLFATGIYFWFVRVPEVGSATRPAEATESA